MSFLSLNMASLKTYSQGLFNNFFSPPSKTNLFVETPIFGPTEWNKYIGNVGEAPPVPKAILDALEQTCLFWPNKKVKETHDLFLVPKFVNDIPLTAQNLEIFLSPLNGIKVDAIKSLSNQVKENFLIESSYWGLMTKYVIPDTEMQSHENQVNFIKQYDHYEIPKAIEVAIGIITSYLRDGTQLLGHNNYTHCQEQVNYWPVAIGSSTLGGPSPSLVLEVYYNDWDVFSGVAGLRKF